jgi:ribosomal protein L34E
MANLLCKHVYKAGGKYSCPDCNQPTHNINWNKEDEYYRKWKIENPNITHEGWWSI